MAQITQESLVKMLMSMENEEGRVTKDDFRVPYMKLHPETKPVEYDALWTKIDKDGDGNLDQMELAAFFGFNFDLLAKDMSDIAAAEAAMAEMDDDQILEALQMEQALRELKLAQEQASKPEVEVKRRARLNSRDEDVKMFKMPTKITETAPCPEIDLLQQCEAGIEPDVIKLITSGVNVRIEDEKGEMPLHKACRNLGSKSVARAILDASEAHQAGSKVKDLNMGDKNGKTPLMITAEFKHKDLMTYLLDCGANIRLDTANGWTVLHTVVSKNDKDLLQAFLTHPNVQRVKKELFAHTDKDARTAMHIAAFKCEEDIVTILASAGASVEAQDSSGNCPRKLAERSGRRKSREIMDGFVK